MTLIRKLALVLCLVLLFTKYSNAQKLEAVNMPITVSGNTTDTTTSTSGSVDLTTGNLISMGSWMGVRYTDNIGVGFCCSGGPNPAMNQDTNTLRFSYGMMAAAQSIALSKVFETIGTGIKVTGYNYSWQINNEGQNSGPLYANVSLVGKNGNLLESYNYDYNRYIPGFETFSGTQKFSVDYGVPSLDSLNVSFTGKDNRFWAGYYGPRVRDVNVSLNYAFDTSKPTAPTTLPTVVTNVDTITASTESSGLLATTQGLPEAVQQAAATGSVVNFDGTVTSTPQTQPQQTQPQQTQQQQTQQQTQQPVQQAVQPAVRVAAEPQKETATRSSGPSSLAMSVVSKVQEAVKTVEKEAVAAAAQQAANDVKNSEQQTQAALASISAQTTQAPQQQSQTALQLQLPQQQQQQQSAVAVMQIKTGEPQVLQTQQAQQSQAETNLYSLTPVITAKVSFSTGSFTQTVQAQEMPQFALPVLMAQTYQESSQSAVRVQEMPVIAAPTQVRGNPLNDLIEGRPTLEAMVQEQKVEELKRSIAPNELETGITLTALAVVPLGYQQYGISLADAKFYDSKPIYQNQIVVDNVRLLRGLGSDQKHQQMVQDQYK
jgi:hypothetical protein